MDISGKGTGIFFRKHVLVVLDSMERRGRWWAGRHFAPQPGSFAKRTRGNSRFHVEGGLKAQTDTPSSVSRPSSLLPGSLEILEHSLQLPVSLTVSIALQSI